MMIGRKDEQCKKKQKVMKRPSENLYINPTSLVAPISPPLNPSTRNLPFDLDILNSKNEERKKQPRILSLAAAEAGKDDFADHLSYFSLHLSRSIRFSSLSCPIVPLSDFRDLYTRNLHPKGRHFVIHQHDHPVAGLHYDLRLQINETSSVSWAIMYGLPGNVRSRRLNRNATETRVHSLWVGQIS